MSIRLSVTAWTIARQAPLSMGFSGQENWSGLPCPPPYAEIYGPLIRSNYSLEIIHDCQKQNQVKWKLPLENLYAGQEATVRTGHGTTDWFQIKKEYVKAVYYHPAYLTYMQSTS